MRYLKENMKSLGKIMLLMYGLTAMLLFLLAALVQRLGLTQGAISIGICLVYVLTCLVGGFFAGKVKRTRKFLWGLFMGLGYVLVMMAITLLAKHRVDADISGILTNFLICLGSGMLGGMIS